jgi:hypothetical protein
MSIYNENPESQAVARLFELSCCGETGNDEFTRLASEVYGSMFESYGVHDGEAANHSDDPVS